MEQPIKSEYVFEESASSIRVVIPSRKSQFIVAFLQGKLLAVVIAVALCLFLVFLIAEYLAVGGMLLWMLWTMGKGNEYPFEIAKSAASWSLPAILIVFLFLSDWLWQVKGYEVVEVEESSIAIRRQLTFGNKDIVLPWPRRYLLAHIDDLCVYARQGLYGRVAFRYKVGLLPKLVRFGSGIEKKKAVQILVKIEKRYPKFPKVKMGS
ncbi:MAG: hypothetical protein GY832_16005 [Chloroflexi bacterium]|nr:hypothetical protein [Chloroflexota bacterium]